MSDAQVKVGVDTKEGVENLKKLKRAAEDAKQELSTFDKVVNTAFGSKNVFQITNFNRAMQIATESVKDLSLVLIAANTAVITFFGAMVKELNKLQGFLSIMTLSTKGTAAANEQFYFLRDTANLLGIDLNVLTSNYAKLVAAIPDGNDKFAIAQKNFVGLAMAARTLHASTLDTQLMFYAVTQMASKGVISMEELRRQLGERLPGAMEIAARALNTTTAALEKAIRTGSVQSGPFLKFFGDEMIRTFAASSEIAGNTVDASLNRLKNIWVDFVKAILDSGAGQAIINVFDALREKLSDPYIAGTFAAMIKDIGNTVTAFIKNLTSADIVNTFSALKQGIELVVNVTLKLIEAMQWVINNSTAVGALIGGLVGASKGAAVGFMFGGPTGALIGAGIGGAAGAIGGGYVGSSFAPKGEDVSQYYDVKREADRQAALLKQQEGVMLQSIMGSLTALGFSGENQASILPMIEKRMGFNANSAGKFAALFNKDKNAGTVYKNLQEQQAAALELAMYGYALGPRGSLEDVLGPNSKKGKEKKTPHLPKHDDLKQGEDYIKMLERQLAKEEQLTEVEKLWRAVTEGRVAFNSEENFLRAKTIAQKIDEANATQALMKATTSLNDAYQDQIDKLTDKLNLGLMTKDQATKENVLREFDQKAAEDLAKIPVHFTDAREAALKLADALRTQLSTALDKVIAQSREFSYGWNKALNNYLDEAYNNAKHAEDIFTTVTKGMEDAFVQFATTGKLSFKSLVDSIITDLARIAARKTIASMFDTVFPFLQGMFGQSGMFWGGNGLAGGDGFVVPGNAGYAAGGPVMGRRAVLVGENGPEVFVPNGPGTIVPNHELGGSSGGGGVTIINKIGSIGSGVSRADVAMAMDQTRKMTIAQIMDMRKRNVNTR